MKLRNKQTGEIGLVHCDATMFSNKIGVFIDNNHIDLRNPYKVYDSLDELTEEWEDYEESKEYWYIRDFSVTRGDTVCIGYSPESNNDTARYRKEIGNYFETKEEVEKAIEKLKAWKRLKDKGFKFQGIRQDYTRIGNSTPFRDGEKYLHFNMASDEDWMKENWEDLELLFGDEE